MPKRPLETRPDDIQVTLANEQSRHQVDESKLIEAAKAVVLDSQFASATISLAIVDDDTMHQLNRQYLEHDYPTDVLSFVLEDDDSHLEGEVIASADTASAVACELGVSPDQELLLYVIHGTLHLVGFRDKTPEEVEEMRAAEQRYLQQFGFSPSAVAVGDTTVPTLRSQDAADQGDCRR
jgi:probable rRNA maturation factor